MLPLPIIYIIQILSDYWFRLYVKYLGSDVGGAYEKPRSFSVVMGEERDVRTAEEPKIIIESGSIVGGLDATINSFAVSVPKTLLITVDVTNSFNFWEDSTNSTYYTTTPSILDHHMMKFP